MRAFVLALVVVFFSAFAHAANDFTNPKKNGGDVLTVSNSTKGEPLNVILSGKSDPYVSSPEGFASYARSIGFALGTCLNIEGNDTARANLGDGDGVKDEAGLYRWQNACSQALSGGNHFRYWVQNGTDAHTNAVFIAASVEKPLKENHMIVPNGYDLGRDQFVGNATHNTTVDQQTGNQFTSKVATQNTALMKGLTKKQINHNIGTDGKVTVLTVQVAKKGDGNANPSGDDSKSSAAALLASMGPAIMLALGAALALSL